MSMRRAGRTQETSRAWSPRLSGCKEERYGFVKTESHVKTRQMQQVKDVGCVRARDSLEVKLKELVNTSRSGYDENGESENAVMKMSLKHT